MIDTAANLNESGAAFELLKIAKEPKQAKSIDKKELLLSTQRTKFTNQVIEPILGYYGSKGEVLILAGSPGTAKSLLALNLAISLSSNRNFLNDDHFKCGIQNPVGLLIDYENGSLTFKMRIPDNVNLPNLFLADRDYLDKQYENFTLYDIEGIIADIKPDYVILDNISTIAPDDLVKYEEARKIMNFLKRVAQEHNILLMAIMHLRKHDSKMKVESNNLFGSTSFLNLAHTVFMLNHSQRNADERYLKIVKARNAPLRAEVLTFRTFYENHLLQIETLEWESEKDHLSDKTATKEARTSRLIADMQKIFEDNSEMNFVDFTTRYVNIFKIAQRTAAGRWKKLKEQNLIIEHPGKQGKFIINADEVKNYFTDDKSYEDGGDGEESVF